MKRLLLLLLLLFPLSVLASPLEETRYCGTPKRDAKGQIIRRADVLAAFQRIHPCPATGLKTGACKGWKKNHALPLACGGCDEVANLYWAHEKIKTCKELWCIDRNERKIYESPEPIPNTAACKNEVITIP